MRLRVERQDNLVLSTRLIMYIGHYRDFILLTFQTSALCQSDQRRANVRNVGPKNSLLWPITNSSDKTKITLDPHR